jgi:membrane associated rhomboid family serine protease
MGLTDRDYYRADHDARGPARLSTRTLSMNTWIITACVAVFLVDLMLPYRTVPISDIVFNDASYENLDPRTLAYGPPMIVRDSSGNPVAVRAVWSKPTGEQVGHVRVMPMRGLTEWLHFSTKRAFLNYEFWRFVGFQFLHANIAHLVLNMIGLFFFGPLVEAYLGSKRFLAFYLLCGIFGAIMYMLLNLIGYVVNVRYGITSMPFLLFSEMRQPLVGASAGVFGVLMAGAYLAPRETVYLFFLFPMQLRTLAFGLVGIALVTLMTSGQNAGGEASHLGGAIAGYYFIRHTHHLHNFFDVLGRVDPTSHHYRKDGRHPARLADPREVDRILDKINREGVHSLTDAEKRTLAQVSAR